MQARISTFRQPDKQGHRQGGTTLPELLVTLAVLAIAASIATSSFLTVRYNTLIRKQISELSHAIFLARRVALDDGTDIALCPSRSGHDCDYSAAWHDGWLLFANRDADDPAQVDSDERIIAVSAASPGLQVTANRRHFVLRPFGLRSTNGTFVVCDQLGAGRPRSLIVSYTGKPRPALTTAGGDPLVCGS